MPLGGGAECAKCNKAVYFQEERRALGKIWHSACFKCNGCNKVLDSHSAQDHEDILYCSHCHRKSFGPMSGSSENLSWNQTVKSEEPKAEAIANTVKGTPRCPRCDKPVYFAEKLDCFGKQYHRMCLKCLTCGHSVDSRTAQEHETELYCNVCYAREFGPTGYGYAGGSGAGLSSEAGRKSTERDITAEAYAAPLKQSNSQTNGLSQSGAEMCFRCGGKVYFAERVIGAGMPYHKPCFKCKNCKKALEAGNECENDKELYCKGCYTRSFGIKAFGYGAGAGGLASCIE